MDNVPVDVNVSADGFGQDIRTIGVGDVSNCGGLETNSAVDYCIFLALSVVCSTAVSIIVQSFVHVW
jgi:hypothetical protein